MRADEIHLLCKKNKKSTAMKPNIQFSLLAILFIVLSGLLIACLYSLFTDPEYSIKKTSDFLLTFIFIFLTLFFGFHAVFYFIITFERMKLDEKNKMHVFVKKFTDNCYQVIHSDHLDVLFTFNSHKECLKFLEKNKHLFIFSDKKLIVH